MIGPAVPTAPVACDTCKAVAGAQCVTGLGTPAARLHAARARAVTVYYEGKPYPAPQSNVVSLDRYRARREARG